MTSYGLDEWFWAMFEPTWIWHNLTFGQLFMWNGSKYWSDMMWTWPNFTFGQLFMWIGENNDQIYFLWAKWVMILSNVRTDLELDLISLLVNFSCELGQIITRYDFLWVRRVILSNVTAYAKEKAVLKLTMTKSSRSLMAFVLEFYLIISRGAEGPGREILQRPPSVRLSVRTDESILWGCSTFLGTPFLWCNLTEWI